MQDAGFAIRQRMPFDVPLLQPYQDFFAKRGKQRFVTVAQSPT